MATNGPTSLNVSCYNVWGLKFIAKHRRARIFEIGRRINSSSPRLDIVGLQECFTQEDYRTIRDLTSSILPYGKFYHGGIFGTGLVILSRWPILESNMFRYPLNGRPTAFFRGDWFVGKGVACARIKTSFQKGDIVEVFCTHLHAPYEREPNDSYLCHRTAQAWEIAKLMRGAIERGHLAIGLGDFNMVPLSLAHQLITSQGKVTDIWRLLQPDSSLGAAIDEVEKARGVSIPTADFNCTVNGATCDSALNTWRWPKPKQKALDKGQSIVVKSDVEDRFAKRLDYIFLGTSSQDSSETAPAWRLSSARIGMTEYHPTLGCSLSDHFSVEASLVRDATDSAYQKSLLVQPSFPYELPGEVFDKILTMIAVYVERERRQRRLRLGHFLVQLVIAVGCLVAVWFSPHNYVAFVLMLLSTLGLSAGVIDGLIGGLFVGSELRALKEFEWEIRNAQKLTLPSASRDVREGSEKRVA